MILVVETPATRSPERDYIFGVLLGDFLGLQWRHEFVEVDGVRIRLGDHASEIRLPDTFFQRSDNQWLSKQSLPSLPLAQWDNGELGSEIALIDHLIPIIYGNDQAVASVAEQRIDLPIDIFGSAFFMLTRYEEAVLTDRDIHDRFPARASLAFRAGFLNRPIIDEYVEILWAAMRRLWPQLQRKVRSYRKRISCDVDNPYEAYVTRPSLLLRRVAGDILKRKSFPLAKATWENYLKSQQGDYSVDPMNTFDWMMRVNEKAGNQVAFYFIADHSVPARDGHYSIHEPRIRALMREMHARGHEIGLHGSYGTYRSATQLAKEAEILRRILDEEGIQQEGMGIRQHFLRWATETPRYQAEAGLTYDTTLSYADYAGFRCGTCHEYPMYDLETRQVLPIKQRPLIVMECSVMNFAYMSMDAGEAAVYIETLASACKTVGGGFSLLWHNSYFNDLVCRQLYTSCIKEVDEICLNQYRRMPYSDFNII